MVVEKAVRDGVGVVDRGARSPVVKNRFTVAGAL
jgi:hypothetical protein